MEVHGFMFTCGPKWQKHFIKRLAKNINGQFHRVERHMRVFTMFDTGWRFWSGEKRSIEVLVSTFLFFWELLETNNVLHGRKRTIIYSQQAEADVFSVLFSQTALPSFPCCRFCCFYESFRIKKTSFDDFFPLWFI